MAPIKFEEQIKDKLEARELQPSESAWARLSDRLDETPKKRKTPFVWWLGIAASVAALVMLSISYFNSSEETQLKQIIVEDTTTKKDAEQQEHLSVNETPKTEFVNTKLEKTPVIQAPKQNVTKPKVVELPATTTVELAKSETKVEAVEESITLQPENSSVIENPLEEKFNDVVAELQKIQEKNNTVTDRQIDSLLKVANKELLQEKLFKEGTNLVDADALLQDVEDELGQSFRTRIYEALKNGFNTVKTKVADRNN